MEKIDMDNHISFKIYKETYVTKNKHVKDLSLLGRKLSTIIIFDSDRVTQARQSSNAISIKRFKGHRSYTELKYLVPFLRSLRGVEYVCPIISSKYAQNIRSLKKDHEIF